MVAPSGRSTTPSVIRFHKVAATTLGGGNRARLMNPTRTRNSSPARTRTMKTRPGSSAFMRLRVSMGLIEQRVEKVVPVAEKDRILTRLHRMARPRQAGLDDTGDGWRATGHNRDAIGEIDRLFDVVGHEYDGQVVAL